MDAGTLGRQVLSACGQLNPGIWGRTLAFGPVGQARQPKRGRLGSRNQPAKPVVFTRLVVSQPKQQGHRE